MALEYEGPTFQGVMESLHAKLGVAIKAREGALRERAESVGRYQDGVERIRGHYAVSDTEALILKLARSLALLTEAAKADA